MTDTSPRAPSVLHLAWPLILSFWMRQLFTFVDTVFAASIGDAAVAGIGLAFPFEFLLIAFWVGASTGMTSLLARAFGAHEGERIEQVIRVSRRVVIALIPTFLALGAAIWIRPALFVSRGVTPDVLEQFRMYGSVIVAGTALTGFWAILPDSIVKAHHDTKATMWAGIASNLLNVALNVLFVLVFHWGMFGIAFSTVLGRLGGLVYALVVARRHESRRLAAGVDTVPGTYERPLRALLALAVPAAVTYVLMATESAIVNALIARGPDPKEALAAYSIWFRYVLFFNMPAIACGVALLPFVARSWGRRDVPAIRRAFRDVVLAASGYVVAIVLPATWLLSRPLVEPLAESPLTRELAAWGLRLVPVACLVVIPFFACRPIFEGLQRGGPGMAMAALRYLALTGPAAWVGGRVAESMGRPPLQGILVAVVLVTAVVSGAFSLWMARALARAEAGRLHPA